MIGEVNEDAFPACGRLTPRDGLLMAATVALTISLRCIHLSTQSVWYDEYITIRSVGAPTLIECIREQLKWDWHMVPVYHALEYCTAQLFAGSILAVRGLSILCGAGAAALIYLIGRRMFSRWAGTVAAICFALSPFHIFHGQEIRPYSLVTFLAMLSVYAFIRALSDGGWRWWTLHVAANVLLMWTHLLGTIILVPMGLFLVLFHFRSWRRNALWGAVHLLPIVLVLLWIRSLQGGMESPKSLPPPILSIVADLFYREAVYLHWVFGSFPLDVTPAEVGPFVHRLLIVQPHWENVLALAFFASCAFLFVASLVRRVMPDANPPSANRGLKSAILHPSEFQWAVFLLLLFATPDLMLYALTYVTHLELFQARFSVYSSPALYLAVGGAVALLGPRSSPTRLSSPASSLKSPFLSSICHPLFFLLRGLAAAAIIALMSVQTVLGVGLPIRHGYLAAARVLRAEKRPEEKLIANSLYTQWLLAYNLGQPPIPTIETPEFDYLCKTTDELLQTGQAFWVVLTGIPAHCTAPPDLCGLADRYTAHLSEQGARFTTRRFLGMQNVHVFHVGIPQSAT